MEPGAGRGRSRRPANTTPNTSTEGSRPTEESHDRPTAPSGIKRMNQTVKRWVAVEPRPQSVLVLVSTGAVGWAFLKRICVMCLSTNRRGAEGGDGRGLGGFPKYPPAPPDPDHNDKDKSLLRTCVCVCVREICFNRRYTKGLSRLRFGNLTAELLFCLFSGG